MATKSPTVVQCPVLIMLRHKMITINNLFKYLEYKVCTGPPSTKILSYLGRAVSINAIIWSSVIPNCLGLVLPSGYHYSRRGICWSKFKWLARQHLIYRYIRGRCFLSQLKSKAALLKEQKVTIFREIKATSITHVSSSLYNKRLSCVPCPTLVNWSGARLKPENYLLFD